MRVRISDAQYAALEQQFVDDHEVSIMGAWCDRALVFTAAEAEPLADLLTDLSNGEDCHSDEMRELGHRECAVAAGRASRSLATLAGRVRKAAKNESMR